MVNVTFEVGDRLFDRWYIVSKMGLNEFVAVRKGYGETVRFRTDAGEGTNYSKVISWTKGDRTYYAQRYLLKYVSTVQNFSNVLYQRYRLANQVG